jgi:protein TIF31
MANDSATAEAATAPVEATTTTAAAANGANTAAQEQAQAEEEAANGIFQITVKLPHEPHELQMTISTAEQVQDLRQSIIEMPHTFQYSCFHH